MDSIAAIEAVRATYFRWLVVSTAAVCFGVVLEETEDFLKYVFSRRWFLAKAPTVVLVRWARLKRWAKFISRVGWVVLIAGCAGEGTFEVIVSRQDSLLQTANSERLEDAAKAIRELKTFSSQALKDSKSAIAQSGQAADKATLAEGASGRALTLSRGAREEADTFEKRLGSAEHKADEAESHVTEAFQRAVEATTALNRIRLPRTLLHTTELATTLRAFKDTQYSFASVAADDESRELLKQIDGMLQLAEWKRVKQSQMRLGVPAFQVFGPNDIVEMGAYTGILISVDSSDSFEALEKLPVEGLPPLVKLAVLLNNGIFSNLSPPEDTKDLNRVDLASGTSKVIRINVGKKP